MKKYTLLIFVLITIKVSGQKKTDPITVFDKLIIDHYKNKKDANIKTPTPYAKFLKNVKHQELTETQFKGKFGFGLTLNNSQNTDLTQFNVSAKIRRGFFPGDFKFNSELNVQLQNGNFVENFSDLSMSYDHHIGNKLNYEGYIFIKRTTNNFLNISQRYETGIGAVWNIYLSGKRAQKGTDKKNQKLLTTKGSLKYKEITDFEIETDSTTKTNSSLESDNNEVFFAAFCNNTICNRANLKEEEGKALKKSLGRSIKSIQKMESKVRLSFLLGINYESEKTSDDLKLFGNNIDSIGNFSPVNIFRLVAGPNIELQLDQFSFNSKLYFKPGISDNDLNNQVTFITLENEFENSKIDYRVEWISSASINFNKNISITGSFRYIHINAPRREFFNTDDGVQLFNAANRFTNFKMGLTYKF
ncbi:hypothetical protein [uncultured Aquimarina sp.]|uniref:hypothetical protein n=1 Tax=uncultured Aquimarina sp. TaxID=575652 RepID=UPI0026176B36|nr:hypothetical protein [uncultured Aquimarina sp.]